MTFVLAHLSDPHLAPLPKPRLRDLIGKRALGFINWRRKRALMHRPDVLARIVADMKANTPDHLAVTGDLVNIALTAEFAAARAWLDSLGSPQDVTLVPGNHDAYVRQAAPEPEHHWGDYMRGDTPGDGIASNAGFPFLRRRGPLALIGLSSAVPTLPLMATGRIGEEQLQRLAKLLEEAKDAFRLVLVHHPPISTLARRSRRLVNGQALRDVLAQHGAELLVHGHDHEHALVWLEGPHTRIAAVGVASASQAPDRKHEAAGYNLYRIDGAPGAWRCDVVSRSLTADSKRIVEIRRKVVTEGAKAAP
jgi:3',5'-cyclic AMP phosphodiesterase CpdA